MDSSSKNPSYGQWLPPSAPFPPPPLPDFHQFHRDRLNGYDRQHQNYHNYTHRQYFPPQSPVYHPPSHYSQPQPLDVGYEPAWNFSHPSCNFSRDLAQSDWVGYMDRNYQLDYGYRTRDYSSGVLIRDVDSYSRSWDGFCSFGESYRDGRFLGAGTSFGYGNDRFGATFHRVTNRYSKIDGVTQRWVKGKESDRSRRSAHCHAKRFDSFTDKFHSGFGSVEKQTVDQKETSCTAGKVIFSDITKDKEFFPQPSLSDTENLSRGSHGLVPFAGSSLHSQPCEDEICKKEMDDLSSVNLHMEEVNDNGFHDNVETNTTTRVDFLDQTVVSQAESKNVSQSPICKSGVNSSVESGSRKESVETTPLNSTADVDHNLDNDAGNYTCTISISASSNDVVGKGSLNVQPVETTSILLRSICKNKDGGTNESIFDRELPYAVYMEDVSLAPNQDLGCSSHYPAKTPYVDQSCKRDCRGLEACLSESNVSLSNETNVVASEFHLNQEVRETATTRDCSPVFEIENTVAIGNIRSSGCETVTDSECAFFETQSFSAGCKVLVSEHLGCGSSDIIGSFWMSSVEKDLVNDPLMISSFLEPDSSVSAYHLSPSVSVNEEIQSSASSVDANCSSLCDIVEEERGGAENMDVDIQEEKLKITGEASQCRTSGKIFVTAIADSMFVCGSSSSFPGLLTENIQNETYAVSEVDETNNSEEHKEEEILVNASQDGEPIEKHTDVAYDLSSQEISLNKANTDVHVGEALSFGGKLSGIESSNNSDVVLSKLHSHADDKCAVAHVKDYEVALPPPDSPSKTTLSSITQKTQKRTCKFMDAAQESYPGSLYDNKKDANPPNNVTKHHTWHRNFNSFASPLVAVKPKVTVQSSSTYVRKGNSLLRKLSSDSLGEAQSRKRHSRPRSDSSSFGKCPPANGLPESSTGEADDPEFVWNRLKSSETLIQTGYASDFQPKQNPLMLESSNPMKMFYAKRKANQLVAASDIHGASNSRIPFSSGYFKRSNNHLVRNSESLANQAKSLSGDALNSQTAAKMVSEGSSSSALSEYAVVRPLNQSKFPMVWTLKEPLSRKAPRVHRSPQKIVPQPVPLKRVTYWRRLMNPASVLPNGFFCTASRKLLMMRKRHTVYRRSTSEYSLNKSKVLSIGGSHLKWSKSVERGSKKPDVESSRPGPPESGMDTKISSIPKRLVIRNDESVWIRSGNQHVRDPKKRTRMMANEKVRWSLHNVRLRQAKRMNYCQFFTRYGKCNKDDGKCPYIHYLSKIAVCTKFLSGLCANPDCKLTHKVQVLNHSHRSVIYGLHKRSLTGELVPPQVLPEIMPDCYYFLQGLCNNEACPYRHVHVHQSAAICEGFLRGYCSEKTECRKKHTYICPVFEATGSCPQSSQCKLHHPKNLRKEKKRKRASETWQKNARGRYFDFQQIHFSESEPILVNELAVDGAVFGGEAADFIRLDVDVHEERENMDSSTTESVSDDSEAHDSIDELIRPVGLMYQ